MQILFYFTFLVVGIVFARPTWKDLHGYTFEKFISDFNHKWVKGTPEYAHREGLFLVELARVVAHNNRDQSTWKEGINNFSAMTLEEKKVSFGNSRAAGQALKPKHQLKYDISPLENLPSSIDWRQKYVVSPVKDQGHCGSCWAFASTAVLESAAALNSGLLFDLAPQQITSCAPNPDSCGGTGGCYGATAEIAFEYIASTSGFVQEFQYPYQSYYGAAIACRVPEGPKIAIDGYVKLPENNYTALMNAIAQVGPIAVAVDANGWKAYESGVYSTWNQTSPDINHVVALVGYGEENGQKYWLVRNSWSASWGEAGYIKLLRSDDDEQNCGMDTDPQNGQKCAGETEPVKVCGTAGILFDGAYPTGARVV